MDSKGTQPYIYMYPFPPTPLPSRLPHNSTRTDLTSDLGPCYQSWSTEQQCQLHLEGHLNYRHTESESTVPQDPQMGRTHNRACKVLTLRGPWVLRSSVRQMQLLTTNRQSRQTDRRSELLRHTQLVSGGTKTHTLAGLTPESLSLPTFGKV